MTDEEKIRMHAQKEVTQLVSKLVHCDEKADEILMLAVCVVRKDGTPWLSLAGGGSMTQYVTMIGTVEILKSKVRDILEENS